MPYFGFKNGFALLACQLAVFDVADKSVLIGTPGGMFLGALGASGRFFKSCRTLSCGVIWVQSVFRSRGLMKIMSFAQIVLAMVGLALLFGTPWAYYRVYGQIGYYSGYRYYSVWYNAPNNAGMGLLTAGFTIMFSLIALFGLGWGWLSSNRTATKYSKLTIVFGILAIVLSLVSAAVITAQEASVYPDASAAGNVSWSLSTALTGFLIGGFLFIIIGFIGTRMRRTAQVPPAPTPLPPPPPP